MSIEVSVGDVVYLVYHNHTEAARIRKSGHGNHWRHRYKVVGLKGYAVKLESIDGSPPLDSWQPLHKVSKSPPTLIDDAYSVASDAYGCVYAPGAKAVSDVITTHPLGGTEVNGPPPLQDGRYEVESIIKAYKVGQRWRVLVKWEGYVQPTEESRADILQDCSPLVRQWIREACAAAILSRHGPTMESAIDGDDELGDGDEMEETDVVNGEQCFLMSTDDLTFDPTEVDCLLTPGDYHILRVAMAWFTDCRPPVVPLRLRGTGHSSEAKLGRMWNELPFGDATRALLESDEFLEWLERPQCVKRPGASSTAVRPGASSSLLESSTNLPNTRMERQFVFERVDLPRFQGGAKYSPWVFDDVDFPVNIRNAILHLRDVLIIAQYGSQWHRRYRPLSIQISWMPSNDKRGWHKDLEEQGEYIATYTARGSGQVLIERLSKEAADLGPVLTREQVAGQFYGIFDASRYDVKHAVHASAQGRIGLTYRYCEISRDAIYRRSAQSEEPAAKRRR